jgi:hypothetical protein
MVHIIHYQYECIVLWYDLSALLGANLEYMEIYLMSILVRRRQVSRLVVCFKKKIMRV